jgi:predicted ATPase
MKAALERHDALLQAAVEGSNGQVVKTTGDGLMAVFASPVDGVMACLQAQHSLQSEPWGETGSLRVRMGLHAGEAQPRGGDYFGPVVNRAARLMSTAHGGQVLLSAAAVSLVLDRLPPGAALRDLGEHRLKDLERPEHIFQLLNPGLVADFPPLATLDRRPNNLPAQPTALIGREIEIDEIVKRLTSEEVRLLTLTGPGGIGKTRTSLQVAAELSDRFQDGVYLVDLAPIRDPEAVLAAIAQTLGLRETSDRTLFDELRTQLQAKSILLLLDNFEQVTAAATHVAKLLRECPGLKLLVTSREALHVRGEIIYPLSPLGLPQAGLEKLSVEELTRYEAVRLFVERAQAVKPDFIVTDDNAAVVAEICARVDGLPLAIELAAARIRLFAPQVLLERLGSRLNLLRGGARDLPARQQALRDTIEWSYELLDGGEQRLFELLSVFSGGCSFEAIEGVTGGIEQFDEASTDVLDRLASLVDKSLIRMVEQKAGESRLVMLETIREYAAERLGQQPDFQAGAQRAYATFYAEFTGRQWERLTGSEREQAFEELGADLENVRGAWRYWVSEKDLQQLGKLLDSLWQLFDVRGWYHATVDLTTDLLNVLSSVPSTPERAQQEVLLRTSLARALLAIKGYTSEVEEAYLRALELSREVGESAQIYPVLRGLFSFYSLRGEFEGGFSIGEQILGLAERTADLNMIVDGHFVLGTSYLFTGNYKQGLEHLEKGISYIDPGRRRSGRYRIGNYPGVSSYTAISMILWGLGYPDRALQNAKKAVALAKAINHPYSLAYALFHIGFLHHWRREVALSVEYAEAVMGLSEKHEFQIWNAVASCLHGAGLAGLDRVDEGLAEIQRGVDTYRELKSPPVFWPLLRSLQASVYGLAGIPEQGLALIDEVLNFPNQGFGQVLLVDLFRLKGQLLVALSPDKFPEAENCCWRALEIAREQGTSMLELRAASSLVYLWKDSPKAEQGRRLLGEAYAKLTEGFDTPDLLEAKQLLN